MDDALIPAVVAFATPRHSTIRRDELRALGATRAWIRHQLSRGWLVPMHRGVYLVGAAEPTLRGSWMAATLACGPGAMLIGAAAATCWGMIGDHRAPALIDVSAARHVRAQPGLRPRRLSWLTRDQQRTCDRIPIASRAATIASLVASHADDELINMLDKAQFRERGVVRELEQLVRVSPTLREGPRILELIQRFELGDAGTESGFEFDVASVLRKLESPPFIENPVLVLPDGGRLKADFYWPDARLVLEADHSQHGLERAISIDLGRDARLDRAAITWVRLPSSIPRDQRRAALAPVVARAREIHDGPAIRIATTDRYRFQRPMSPRGRVAATL